MSVVAWTLISCGQAGDGGSATVNATHQQVNSTNKVLILGSSVSGGLTSREALAVAAVAPTAQIDVVTPAQWKAMTAQQFMSYRALIIGDSECRSSEASFQAALETRNVWGEIVDGDVALLSTDPTHNHTPLLVENAIQFVLNSVQKRTGMYIALGCAYQNTRTPTPVALLEPFGLFTVQGVPDCADRAHMLEMNNNLISADVTDTGLRGDGCAARSVFTRFPEHNFSFAALAMSASGKPIPGQRPYSDYLVNAPDETHYVSTPYILVRGASALGAGCGLASCTAARQCDLGDLLNGQPAVANQAPDETCSYSCHLNWCGDGHVDAELGEECDLGVANGRTNDPAGNVGACTSFCKLPHSNEPPVSQAPVALCQNVTKVADATCGAAASIDNGSYDPDGDLVSCTQSLAGPFNVGSTSVTLTCTDQAGHSSSCTGVVTVTDTAPPYMTLKGSETDTVECTVGGTYADPGATATDTCDANPTLTRTGSVDMGTPGSYPLSYSATDSSGNTALPVQRKVTVHDTLAPQIVVKPGPDFLQCNGPAYQDPGATASDRCDGDLTSRITTTSNLNQSQQGQYTVTYRVQDDSGYAATATRQLTVGPCSTNTCVDLHLSDYNLFLLENYEGGHDVVGKVAAGGNISLTHFAVGAGLDNGSTANTLVAGGNLTLKHGAVWGDARYGGTYSADGTVVYPRGSVARGTPINFAARFAELNQLAVQLAGMTVNGSTTRTSWGGILLRGTSTGVNVFDLDGNAFNGARLLSIEAPAGSLVVVNIRGSAINIVGGGTSFSGGIDQHGVVYNFFEATSISATGFGIFGTVLAPSADISFNNGSWDGGIYAKSLSGNAEGHINPLNDRNICQP
ncbi:choice-of-anchor A family protein [Hyalangium versicolor]|uniref:choice-of-anchor A family protein n=1 Tax=Hyalangium versicolor TaxID=2861190 RepID=UPI002729B012|nr:choice-of-anchor A family protein [Hyalangium versicolor]